MTAAPAISVVIPCFNHGEFLPEAVASVTSTHRNDLELVVIDDGSTDERTRKELDSLQASGIRVIRQENQGPSAARNNAILASKGKYILPLDADDRLRPSFLDSAITILDSQPQVGIVYGDAEWFGLRTGRYTVGPFDRNRLLYWNFIPVSAVYRRSVWEQNGGYDSTARPEDYDFWLCALEHGWQFAYVPEILFEYRILESSRMMTTYGRLSQLAASISKKHGPLYRRAWVERQSEHDSGRATLSNLCRLIKLRLKQKFRLNGSHEWICPKDPVPSYGEPPRAPGSVKNGEDPATHGDAPSCAPGHETKGAA
jgi:glycosyltransferase involved in cell wall biosynthesis